MNNNQNTIRMIRIKQRLSQKFIAKELGLNQSQYSRRENGSIDFSVTEILKLKKIFNVSYEELFDTNYLSREVAILNDSKMSLVPTVNILNRNYKIIDFILSSFDIFEKIDLKIEEKEYIINSLKSKL
jgi:transcriptional regulator with XRE-family HTH domain